MFGDSFDQQLHDLVVPLIKDTLKQHNLSSEVELHHEDKTVVCMVRRVDLSYQRTWRKCCTGGTAVLDAGRKQALPLMGCRYHQYVGPARSQACS
jgi:hypothetical protein